VGVSHKPNSLILRPFSAETLDTPCYRGPRKAFASKSFKTPDGPLRRSGVFHFLGLFTMSSQAQVAANQSNAQHSSGPKTPAGKAIVAQNNFRHGFTGGFRVLEWENQEDYRALQLSLEKEHQPATPTEEMLVETMAHSYWLRKRALILQNTCFSGESPACNDEKNLALYIRYQNTHDRAFHRALNDLLKLPKNI
jgi:hypothetical protein